MVERGTEANCSKSIDCGTDPEPLQTSTVGCQQNPISNSSHTQTEIKKLNTISTMIGCTLQELVEAGVGRDEALLYNSQSCQTFNAPLMAAAMQTETPLQVGCGVQVRPPSGLDFACGDKIADLKLIDKSVAYSPDQSDACIETDVLLTSEFGVQISPEYVTVAIGDGDVNDVVCDRCSTLQTRDYGSGCHVTTGAPSCMDDKLCECVKPTQRDAEVGDHTVTDNFCDHCDNLQTRTVGVSEDSVSDVMWCDKCTNLKTHEICIGGDYDIDNILCDSCDNKPETNSVAIGDFDVTNQKCDNCENNKSKRDSTAFNFDFDFSVSPPVNSQVQQQPIICHYCGNKVDLNDDSVDETLQAMRDSMQSLAGQHGGLKRSGGRKHLNLELADDEKFVFFFCLFVCEFAFYFNKNQY